MYRPFAAALAFATTVLAATEKTSSEVDVWFPFDTSSLNVNVDFDHLNGSIISSDGDITVIDAGFTFTQGSSTWLMSTTASDITLSIDCSLVSTMASCSLQKGKTSLEFATPSASNWHHTLTATKGFEKLTAKPTGTSTAATGGAATSTGAAATTTTDASGGAAGGRGRMTVLAGVAAAVAGGVML